MSAIAGERGRGGILEWEDRGHGTERAEAGAFSVMVATGWKEHRVKVWHGRDLIRSVTVPRQEATRARVKELTEAWLCRLRMDLDDVFGGRNL